MTTAEDRKCYISDEDCTADGYTSMLPDGRIVCNTHYGRWNRHGDPEHKPSRKVTRRGEIDKWVAKMLAANDDECWLWPFDTLQADWSPSYGKIGKWGNTTAPRAVLMLSKGAPPNPDYHACHLPRCKGKPLCVNPRHLRWGSPTENAADKQIDGTIVWGERHWAASTDNVTAQAIWDAEGTRKEITERFGVSRSVVAAIKEGRRWPGIDRSKPAGGTRRGKVTREMAIAIIPDDRDQTVIGRDYGIAASTVSNIKNGIIHPDLDRSNVALNKPGGGKNRKGRSLDLERAQQIYDDDRPTPMIAKAFGVTNGMVDRIKDGLAWPGVDRSHPPGQPDPALYPEYVARYGNRRKKTRRKPETPKLKLVAVLSTSPVDPDSDGFSQSLITAEVFDPDNRRSVLESEGLVLRDCEYLGDAKHLPKHPLVRQMVKRIEHEAMATYFDRHGIDSLDEGEAA